MMSPPKRPRNTCIKGSAGRRLMAPNSTGVAVLLPFGFAVRFPAYHRYCLHGNFELAQEGSAGATVCTGFVPTFMPSSLVTWKSTSCACNPTEVEANSWNDAYGFV